MIIYVDIDDTICSMPKNSHNYAEATPMYDRIAKINDLHNSGHTIIYWTARGSKTGINWQDVTVNQLNRWLVKYDQIFFDKPVYDLFIDDKNINAEEYFK